MQFIMGDTEDLTAQEMLFYKRINSYEVKVSSIQCYKPEKFEEVVVKYENPEIVQFEVTNITTPDIGHKVDIEHSIEYEKISCIVSPIRQSKHYETPFGITK